MEAEGGMKNHLSYMSLSKYPPIGNKKLQKLFSILNDLFGCSGPRKPCTAGPLMVQLILRRRMCPHSPPVCKSCVASLKSTKGRSLLGVDTTLTAAGKSILLLGHLCVTCQQRGGGAGDCSRAGGWGEAGIESGIHTPACLLQAA